jgi:RNA polymerase sigma factor (sigma-70 family)
MGNRQLGSVLQFLRRLAGPDPTAGLSDGQLLRRYIEGRDQTAFAALVERHGRLVLAVCRRLLPTLQDAEDAFQATFLILVRQARAITKHESVGSWLHGVAHRVALRAKASLIQRRARERQQSRPPAPDTLQEVVWRDLRAILEEEVLRLPARCREPFVLCYLEGKTNEAAARLLGCPRGTVLSRLARARELLRARLTRRGLILSAGLVATMLARSTATAAVPAVLAEATVTAAGAIEAARATFTEILSPKVVALMEGVLKAMRMTRLTIAASVFLLLALAGIGTAVFSQPAAPPVQLPAPPEKEARPEEPPRPALGPLLKHLQAREWLLTAVDAKKGRLSVSYQPQADDSLGRFAAGFWEKGLLSVMTTGLTVDGLEVAPDAKVLLDGETVKLKDLKTGMRVVLWLGADKLTVTKINAASPRAKVGYHLKAVDPVKNVISVTTGDGSPVGDLPVAKDARIFVQLIGWGEFKHETRTLKLADLKPGMLLSLQLAVDGDRLVVRSIQVSR